ncbi:N-acetyltransferase [Lachnospiraceae bacterium]|nr:N-acetyltransferase [Lachnospiraceae bacterium]
MRKVKIHESASVDLSAKIGLGTSIWQNCIIQDDVIIGEMCNIGANVFIEKGVRIGKGVKIKNNIAIYTGVVIEDDVFFGPNCVFTNVINPRSFISRKQEFKETVLKKGATIGANATIICGHTIGKYSMVGAGTVVAHDVKDYSLVVGNPDRQIGFVCKCGCRLDKEYRCCECGKEYKMINSTLISLKRH